MSIIVYIPNSNKMIIKHWLKPASVFSIKQKLPLLILRLFTAFFQNHHLFLRKSIEIKRCL